MSTAVSTVKESLEDEKSSGIIKCLSCRCRDGTGGLVSLTAYSADRKALAYCANPAIVKNPLEKILLEDSTELRGTKMSDNLSALKGKIKKLLDRDKRDAASSQIEDAAKEMFGDDNFVFEREAETLAEIDVMKLQNFIDRVVSIREKLDADYYFATKKLIGDDDGQS